MTLPRLRRPSFIAAAGFILIALCHPSDKAASVSTIVGTGCRALREIRAEAGIVLPKGTEFRFHEDPLDRGGGTITLTLIIDNPETLKAQFVSIDNPSLMYHVTE